MRLPRPLRREKTREEKRARLAKRPRSILSFEAAWPDYEALAAKDWAAGRRAEKWEVYAAFAGWRPMPRLTLMGHLKICWPQRIIHELMYSESPFMEMLRKEERRR